MRQYPMTSLPSLSSEWLQADGLGGYMSSTVSGARTRTYHALLMTAAEPPVSRYVLVNGLEAWVEIDTEKLALSTQIYEGADGGEVRYPDGERHLAGFSADPWPVWRWNIGAGTVIQELIVGHVPVDDRSAVTETILRFRTEGLTHARLTLRPLLSGRDHGTTHHENSQFSFEPEHVGDEGRGQEILVWRPYPGVPAIRMRGNFKYRHEPLWYRNFLYTTERDRGYPHLEDLAAPGTLTFELAEDEGWLGLASSPVSQTLGAGWAAEAERRKASTSLERAAFQYVVRRGEAPTIMAGYPWFADWGRDTFICLRGLMTVPDGVDTARRILLSWAGFLSEGMLPNRFPDQGGAPEYNTVDAALWYVVSVHALMTRSTCAATLAEEDAALLRRTCLGIVKGYTAGTRHGIRADSDGLLAAGEPGVQLTWMDAKYRDWVVTPRIGKPVEIEALWTNALTICASWDESHATLRDAALASFVRRFPQSDGSLFDVVDCDHIAGRDDGRCRPNQIFAVGGLPFPLLRGQAARNMVDAVERRLLTPMGLRTLAPDDPDYCAHYAGDLPHRDGAYHQGTCWPWLIGAFVEAWLSTRTEADGDPATLRRLAAERFIKPLLAHRMEGGLGHVTEVADGDPPHTAGGCPFQAWSMMELLRARNLLEMGAEG